MKIPSGVRRAFRLPTTAERIVRELDDEVRFHVEHRAEALRAAGYSREQAYAEALRKFGDVDDLKAYCVSIEVAHMRRVEKSERFRSIMQDARYALRQFAKSPGFAIVATLTLALGIGATTAIFSVVNGVLLRALPFHDSERIVQLWGLDKNAGILGFADPTFDDVARMSTSFSAIAKYNQGGTSFIADGTVIPIRMAMVSREFFDVLDTKPMLGRFFVADEQQPGAPPAAVISYNLWERQFNKSASAPGSVVQVPGGTMRIIGVLPRGAEFPEGTDIYLPAELRQKLPSRTAHNWKAVARLKPGITLARATQDFTTILKRAYAEVGNLTWTVDGKIIPLQKELVGDISKMLYLLFGASGVLLLIACANVVNLLVARMAIRESEIAVRMALGAGRGRLVQQLLIESLLLACVACALSLCLAFAGVRALLALRPANIPRVAELSIDWRVLTFAVVVSFATAAALGLIAALRGTSGDLRSALSQSQRTQSGGASYRVRGALVVVQLAMTVVLLIGAGLLARSFVHIMSVDAGFRTHGVVLASVSTPDEHGAEGYARRVQYYDEAMARLRAIPGVTAVGGVNHVPLWGGGPNGKFLILPGVDVKLQMSDVERLFQDKEHTGDAKFRVASTDYFRSMNIPLLSGRLFDDRDRSGAPDVAVISQRLVKERWPNESPLGKVIEFGNMDGDLTPITIVGVVGDVREYGLIADPEATVYVSYRQRPMSAGDFVFTIATPTEAAAITSARQILRQLRSDVPIRLATIEERVGRSLAQQRFMLLLVGVFGAVALVLATLGVYSVIAYLVAQRGREISIRVAMGAHSSDIMRLVLAQGVKLAFVGMLIGGIAAMFATRLLKKLLYEITTTDPIAFGGVLILLCVVALVASWVPARRAAQLEPMDVLRAG